MVVTVVRERVDDVIDCALNSSAERVIVACVVVISHSTLGLERDFLVVYDFGLSGGWSAALVLDVVGWMDSTAVFTLGVV